MRLLTTGLLLTSVLISACAAPTSSTRSTSRQQEPAGPSIGCVDISTVTAATLPVSIQKGARDCIIQGNYDKAIALYALGGVDARYDTLRVTDKTAHQAATILAMYAVTNVPETNRQTFFQTLQAMREGNPKYDALCSALVAKGPPTYTPTYMVNHGMVAFKGNTANALVADFSPATAWPLAIQLHIHCPVK
jgi:hypothetical protein